MGKDDIASLDKIRQVRSRVEVGLADAKRALIESNGDVDVAVRSFMTPELEARERNGAAVLAEIERLSGRAKPVEPPKPRPAIVQTSLSVTDWVRAQLEASAPPEVLVPGGVGRPVFELASAVHALEQGAGPLFGMHLDGSKLIELRPLAARARVLLDHWCARAAALEGSEGVAAIHTIAARAGVTLPTMSSNAFETALAYEPDAWKAALGALESVIEDGAGTTEWWREAGRLTEDDDVVVVETGATDLAALRDFAVRYEARCGRVLPRFYVRLLATYNGLAVANVPPEDDDGQAHTVAPPADLEEPLLWPIGVYGDHFLFDGVDIEGILAPFVFAQIQDSGYFVFDAGIAEGRVDDAPTFWLPNGRMDQPTRVTDSILDWVTALAGCRLCAPALLGRTNVPGWGS